MVQITARLVRFTPEGQIAGIASGFILKRAERYLLISAGHSFWSGAQWFLETDCSTTSETILIPLCPVQLMSVFALTDLEKLLAEEAAISQPGVFQLPEVMDECLESKAGEPLDIA